MTNLSPQGINTFCQKKPNILPTRKDARLQHFFQQNQLLLEQVILNKWFSPQERDKYVVLTRNHHSLGKSLLVLEQRKAESLFQV